MQCKDIPDIPILELMATPGPWFTHRDVALGNTQHLRSLSAVFPPGCPERLRRAKMAQLIKRGLVTGCACGCRGDYELTAEGRAFIARTG